LKPSPPEIGELEQWAHDAQLAPVIGVDEAGRGPLAGPVVAAAVALPAHLTIGGLNDSKQVSPKQREHHFDEIQRQASAYGIGICEAGVIDSIGILPATFQAMAAAIQQVLQSGLKPALVMVDGNLTIPQLTLPQKAFVKGDGRSLNIAAASILAKVTRDRLLVEYHEQWPVYGFAQHKGYGTAQHLDALAKHGPCPIHRRSFRPVSECS
jgi:ribonuclease HII